MKEQADKNDEFRRTLRGGAVVITTSIARLPSDMKLDIIDAVRKYDDFGSYDTKHNFGILTMHGYGIGWRIDYLGEASGDDTPLLSVMLADEM